MHCRFHWFRNFSLGSVSGVGDSCGKSCCNCPAFRAGIRSAHATSQDLHNHCEIDDSLPQSVETMNHAGVEASYVSETYILRRNHAVKPPGQFMHPPCARCGKGGPSTSRKVKICVLTPPPLKALLHRLLYFALLAKSPNRNALFCTISSDHARSWRGAALSKILSLEELRPSLPGRKPLRDSFFLDPAAPKRKPTTQPTRRRLKILTSLLRYFFTSPFPTPCTPAAPAPSPRTSSPT